MSRAKLDVEKERKFVDREVCIDVLRDNIQKLGTQEHKVLFYYGIAGIGKSILLEKLQNILDNEYPEVLWGLIDLKSTGIRKVDNFLLTLKKQFEDEYKAKFYLFNTVHAIYSKKAHPEIPLQIQNYPLVKEGGFLNELINLLNKYTFIPVRFSFYMINNAPDYIKKNLITGKLDIHKLISMKTQELERLLPRFFAEDFKLFLGTDSKVCIFIDTYEALWEGIFDIDNFHQKDKWIRDDLISNMHGVSWIISGREKLRWASVCDQKWQMWLEQQEVEELSKYYCTIFLKKCLIKDKDIQEIIINASKGVPLYLSVSVRTFEDIIINKKRQPTSEDFGKTQPEIFENFVRYHDKSEIHALEALSVLNFWNRDIFDLLMKYFGLVLQFGAFSNLIESTIIKKDIYGQYSMHQLMRNSLQEHLDSVDRENVHKFMFEYYKNKLENIDSKAITPEHETALREAFYHAKESQEAEELFYWFNKVQEPFDIAAHWQLIVPMYEEMLQILETKIGTEHHNGAAFIHNLAVLYFNMGDYKKALQNDQMALEITEKVLGPEHPDVAPILSNLAGLYCNKGDYKEALLLAKRSLDIREKVLGPEHSCVATALNNLAFIHQARHQDRKDYEKALSLYQRALDIREKVLGPEHTDVAQTLNNLAYLYQMMDDYEKALPLYNKALEINEKLLGPQHPEVAINLTNLARFYYKVKNYEKALQLYNKALEINEKVLGPEHIDVTPTLNDLALIYRQIGDYEKALSLHKKALDIRVKVWGPENPVVEQTLNDLTTFYYDLVLLYCSMEKYEKALLLYQRALDIVKKILGPQHPNVALIQFDFLLIYSMTGMMNNYKKTLPEKTLPLYQGALDICEKEK